MGIEGAPKFEILISQAWGNPEKVAKIAFGELFEHPDIGLDYDDQVSLAMSIGILAGSVSDPQTFIQRFKKEIIDIE